MLPEPGQRAPPSLPASSPPADEMGLGKTLQAISLLSFLKFERGVEVGQRAARHLLPARPVGPAGCWQERKSLPGTRPSMRSI